MSRYSESQKRATAKYKAANYKRISFDVPLDFAFEIKAAAAVRGMSVNGFIRSCIEAVLSAAPPDLLLDREAPRRASDSIELS